MTSTAQDELDLATYLRVQDPKFQWVATRFTTLLESHEAPSLNATALELMRLIKNQNVEMSDLERVISLDPGLASRCIKVASTVHYGGHRIKNVSQALLLIGMKEIRCIAFAVAVVDSFSRLRIKVDWNQFWLHSILVGRLTEKIASAFRETNGTEYLAGLLHDMGKLMIEHHFPREFEMVVIRSMERNCGHAAIEPTVLGLDHTQIGAAICHCMHLEIDVRHAVNHHHRDFEHSPALRLLPDQGFLAACVSVADSMANMGHINIGGQTVAQNLETQPAWNYLLKHFEPEFGLELDLQQEIQQAKSDLHSIGLP